MSIICPKGKGCEKSFEEIDGIAIYRHVQPFEASGAFGYLAEYSWALLAEFTLSLRVLMERGFDAIHVSIQPSYNHFFLRPHPRSELADRVLPGRFAACSPSAADRRLCQATLAPVGT